MVELTAIPPSLPPLLLRPHFLIVKGGITSNDVAVEALGIERETCPSHASLILSLPPPFLPQAAFFDRQGRDYC